MTADRKLLWLLAIVKAFFFSSVSLTFATLGALNGIEWQNMGPQMQFTTILSIYGSWGTTMMAFLTNSATQIRKGDIPINGDSEPTK